MWAAAHPRDRVGTEEDDITGERGPTRVTSEGKDLRAAERPHRALGVRRDERFTVGVGATIVVGVAAGLPGGAVDVVVAVDGAGVVSEGDGVHVQGEVAA